MLLALGVAAASGWVSMEMAPAPVLNPLKGLVPYQRPAPGRFPHSMEFQYVPVNAVVKGKDRYDWTALEALLEDVRSRGNQTIFRFYLEYPNKPSAIPEHLVTGGLKVHRYTNTNTQPLPPAPVETPDYGDPRLVSMLREFIVALGKKYDGDPRIAYITAGLLGTWGEWHTYPRDDLHPPKSTQTAVMDAYEIAFKQTPILLRYPAGKNDGSYASNVDRPIFGFHDDSFAWATLPTGEPNTDWFFVPKLRAAGVQDRWRTRPIGGEIRPEAWGVVFDSSGHPAEMQSFRACVDATRVSWLMDSGMFASPPSPERLRRAEAEVARMGYNLSVTRWSYASGVMRVELANTGVAPFYAGWPLELGRLDPAGRLVEVVRIPFRLSNLMPGEKAVASVRTAPSPGYLFRIPNPMRGGKPVRFGNRTQDSMRNGWLTLAPPPQHRVSFSSTDR